eukprot:3257945-Pleurochrysis_carterae.AAC.1
MHKEAGEQGVGRTGESMRIRFSCTQAHVHITGRMHACALRRRVRSLRTCIRALKARSSRCKCALADWPCASASRSWRADSTSPCCQCRAPAPPCP